MNIYVYSDIHTYNYIRLYNAFNNGINNLDIYMHTGKHILVFFCVGYMYFSFMSIKQLIM